MKQQVPDLHVTNQHVSHWLWTIALTLLWVVLSTSGASAQETDQVISIGGNDSVSATDMVIDNAGNRYITGWFWGTVEFGTGTLTTAGASDIFIAKYDPQGSILWTQQIGGNREDGVSAFAIDSAGNIYITGGFHGTINFGSVTFTNVNVSEDIFVAKYDTNGNFLWANHMSGGTGNAVGKAISVDSGGNHYVAGLFQDIVDFGNETLTTSGGYDSFVAKYDTNGNFLWTRQMSGPNDQLIQGVAEDDGRVFVTGTYLDSISFGSGTTTSRGNQDLFIGIFADDGTLVGVGSAGGEGQDAANDITVDPQGNLLVTGEFEGVADFGPITVTNVGHPDGFVAKYDRDGAPLWVQQFGGDAASVNGYRLLTVSDGAIYVAGSIGLGQAFFGSIEIAGEEGSSFVARYDSSGNAAWVRQITSSVYISTDALVRDSNGYLYVAGTYDLTAYVGSFTLTTSQYPQEAFIARWAPTPSNDLIFSDGFESGDFSAWTNYSSDFGDLSVTIRAALAGGRGLQALLDDNVSIGVRDELPESEDRYLTRFRIHPHSLSMAQDENHVIFFGYSGSDLRRPVLRLELRHHDDWYQLRAALLNDGFTWRTTAWRVIGDEPTRVSLEWYAATEDGANNGSLLLRVNDQISLFLTGVDNDTRRIDTVRLGAIAGIDDGTRGTYYFDLFESRRLTYVDPNALITAAMPSEVTAWTEVDESDPEEATLMQEVLEYAEQVEKEEGEQESPPAEEEQAPQLFLPYLNRG